MCFSSLYSRDSINVKEFSYPTDHMVFLTLGIFMFNSIFMTLKTNKNTGLSTPLLLNNEHYGHLIPFLNLTPSLTRDEFHRWGEFQAEYENV